MNQTEKRLLRLKHQTEDEIKTLKQQRDMIEQNLEDYYFLLDYVKSELEKKLGS